VKQVHPIKSLEVAKVLMNPVRIAILELLREPMTCAEIATRLEMSQQRIHNHIKELRNSNLVQIASTRQKRNLLEAVYQSSGKLFWLSPEITRSTHTNLKELQESLSLHNLLVMSEKLSTDAAYLLDNVGDEEIPSLGITADIFLESEDTREKFAKDYLKLMHQLLEKYQSPPESSNSSEKFTAMLICYPQLDPVTEEQK